MAIQRNTYGSSDGAPSDSEVMEAAPDNESSEGESQYPPAEVSLDSIGDKQEGDTVQMKVVSIDQDSGMATLQCEHPGEEPVGSGSIKKAAEAFSEE